MTENTWYLRTQDETFGPESKAMLIEWAQMGRIQPGQEVSGDNLIWQRVEDVPFLDMRFSIDIGDGNPRGPFNRQAAEKLLASGRLPPVAKMVEVRDPFPEETAAGAHFEEMRPQDGGTPVGTSVLHQEGLPGFADAQPTPREDGSPVTETPTIEPTAEPAVELSAEQAVELPTEQSVELPTEQSVVLPAEQPAEKVVEKIVEKVVVDETRVKELEALLEEERRHAAELQVRLDEAKKDVEAQQEAFQQKSEAAAREFADQLESARQKSEIAAQDAEAQLAEAKNSAAARLKDAEAQIETLKSESVARLAEERQKADAARKDAEAQLEACRQKAETAAKEAEARYDQAQKEAAARCEQLQKEAAERLEQTQKDAAARYDQAQKEAVARIEELQQKLTEAQQKAETVQKDADTREQKSREQIVALENELRRLPQAASEIADVQAAVYGIMTKEAAELAELLETEKREADEFRHRQQERADRLLERRRELLKRTGANIEDMTRKALVERPEDPRTVQLRREYEEFRRADEKKSRAYEDKLLAKTREIEELRREISKRNVSDKDATQLQAEVVALQERLQRCEKDLLSERQQCEELRQRQATSQQVLMARLATLESPTIAPAQTFTASAPETRQSREAKAVKLPRWMQLGGKR